MLISGVSGVRVRGKPRLVWMDHGSCEGDLLQQRDDGEATQQGTKGMKEWRTRVHM